MLQKSLYAFTGLLCYACSLAAAPLGYVTSEAVGSTEISVVDLATNAISGTIPVGFTTRNIVASSDGARVYATCPSDGYVVVVDTATNSLVATIPVVPIISSPLLQGIAVSPDDAFVYVANSNDNTVYVINALTNSVEHTISVGSFPQNLAVSSDGTLLYVTNFGSSFLSVIDTASYVAIASPSIDLATSIAIAPNGTFGYAGSLLDGIYRLNTTLNTLTPAFSVTGVPRSIAFTPDSTTAYIALGAPNPVSVVNTTTNTVIDNVSAGTNSQNITITPDGARAYVVDPSDEIIYIIETSSNTVIGNISGLNAPQDMAIISSSPPPPQPPQPPTNGHLVSQKAVQFLTQQYYSNTLSWSPPSSGPAPISYVIFGDASLTQVLATISAAGPLVFEGNSPTTYLYIVSVDALGERSAPLVIK